MYQERASQGFVKPAMASKGLGNQRFGIFLEIGILGIRDDIKTIETKTYEKVEKGKKKKSGVAVE